MSAIAVQDKWNLEWDQSRTWYRTYFGTKIFQVDVLKYIYGVSLVPKRLSLRLFPTPGSARHHLKQRPKELTIVPSELAHFRITKLHSSWIINKNRSMLVSEDLLADLADLGWLELQDRILWCFIEANTEHDQVYVGDQYDTF